VDNDVASLKQTIQQMKESLLAFQTQVDTLCRNVTTINADWNYSPKIWNDRQPTLETQVTRSLGQEDPWDLILAAAEAVRPDAGRQVVEDEEEGEAAPVSSSGFLHAGGGLSLLGSSSAP